MIKYTWCQLGIKKDYIFIISFEKFGKRRNIFSNSYFEELRVASRRLLGANFYKGNEKILNSAEFRRNNKKNTLEMRWKKLIPGDIVGNWFEIDELFTVIPNFGEGAIFDNPDSLELYLTANNLWGEL